MNDELPVYDRELLLLGAKRNAVLDLWEVSATAATAMAIPTMSPSTGCGQMIGMRRASGCWDGRPSNARVIDWGMRLAKRLPLLLARDHPVPGHEW